MRGDANAIIGKAVPLALRAGLRQHKRHVLSATIPDHESTDAGGFVDDAYDGEPRYEDHASEEPRLFDMRGLMAAIKDNFVTNDYPTTCASNILRKFAGPPATVVQLLKRAGVKIVGKTNMDEFGMGSYSTNSAFGPVRNPDFRGQVFSAGGSSGGSAMAVAEDVVNFALGSDTGGSVRLPAAYTQTVGFKPSYGRISRHGLIPYANSLDTVGIIARSPEDILNVFRILDRPDSKDPTCLSAETRNWIRVVLQKRAAYDKKLEEETPIRARNYDAVKVLRLGVPMEYNIQEMHPLVRTAWMQSLAEFRAYGHEIVPISLPTTMHALAAYYILAPAEASSNLAKYDGVRYGAPRDEDWADDEGGTLYASYRGSLFGEEVKRRILLGSYTLSTDAIDNYFIKAQKVRRLVQHDFNLVFRMPNPLLPQTKYYNEGVDYIICPTAPTPPPLLRELNKQDPVESYMNDVFTVPASLAGLPALSMPPPPTIGEEAGVERTLAPSGVERAVGIQIIGQFGDDDGLLRFAHRESGRFLVRDWKRGRLNKNTSFQ